jgi:hypothetical protein
VEKDDEDLFTYFEEYVEQAGVPSKKNVKQIYFKFPAREKAN